MSAQSNGQTDLVLEPLPSGELAWLRPAVVQLNPAPQSSVQLEQAAKGPPRITVKVYATSTAEAADIAQRTYDELMARYAQIKRLAICGPRSKHSRSIGSKSL